MRPRPFAADNSLAREAPRALPVCFNEAAAFRRG